MRNRKWFPRRPPADGRSLGWKLGSIRNSAGVVIQAGRGTCIRGYCGSCLRWARAPPRHGVRCWLGAGESRDGAPERSRAGRQADLGELSGRLDCRAEDLGALRRRLVPGGRPGRRVRLRGPPGRGALRLLGLPQASAARRRRLGRQRLPPGGRRILPGVGGGLRLCVRGRRRPGGGRRLRLWRRRRTSPWWRPTSPWGRAWSWLLPSPSWPRASPRAGVGVSAPAAVSGVSAAGGAEARLSLRRWGRVRGSPPRTSEWRSSVIAGDMIAHRRSLCAWSGASWPPSRYSSRALTTEPIPLVMGSLRGSACAT